MIKIDENDPIGEVDPSFPYRDVVIRKNTDMKEFYDLQKEIGRGKFGTVYRCTEKSTGLKLAAKFIGISKRQDRRNAEREVEIMRELQHPRLIQMYDAFEINNIMCVVLELIEGGELFERVIDDDFILTEKSVSVFMRQICEGIAFIHSKNILHLDMKPENILCLTKTGNRIKIIDFGLARKYDPEKKLQVLFGTPEFVAPEVVNFDSIGFGTDMWSVGVICYVLLSGLSPFMGETDVQTMANVTIAQYDFDDEAFNDISPDAKDFIGKLLLKDREQRMSASECLSHSWLQRRKPPVVSSVTSPNPTISQSELDLQKDTLRFLVDRWNNDTNITLVTNKNDDKCDKVIDICKTNGIIEQQSKSIVCEPNLLPANDITNLESAIQHPPTETAIINNNSTNLETTLVPIQSIEALPASKQILKSLSDVASSNRPVQNLKRSLSPDTVKIETSKKEQSAKISKSLTPSRSGSISPAPAIYKEPMFNGEADSVKDEPSPKLPKPLKLEIPTVSSQKEFTEIKKSPSVSPKPLKKKTVAKTPSPSIQDHSEDHKDKPKISLEEIRTNEPSQKLPKSPSSLEIPKTLPQKTESTGVEKSSSTSPKPLKKSSSKTPSPSIKDQPDKFIPIKVENTSSQEIPSSPLLEIPENSTRTESSTTKKSPSTSPKPFKKKLTKTPSPSIKDQPDEFIPIEVEITSNSNQQVPKPSSLELPKNLTHTESSPVKKSPSTSPKPLKKKPTKTASPLIQDQQSDLENIDTKLSHPVTPEKSPQRDISDGKKSPKTISPSIANSADILMNKFQSKVVEKISAHSPYAKICDTVKQNTVIHKTSQMVNSKGNGNSTVLSYNSVKDENKLKKESEPQSTKDTPILTPGLEPAQGINKESTKESRDKLHDIPGTDSTNQSQSIRTPTVEISDETYEYVKKRRFTIKSVESTKTVDNANSTTHTKSTEKTTIETSPQFPSRRSIFSPEVSPKVLRKLNDFISTSDLMKRRISDISNLLTRTEQDMEQSIPDDMNSFCNKLNRIVRLRHDSYSIDGSSNYKRPKFRISYLSRDVPLASTSPLHADLLNYLPFGEETTASPVWSFQKNNAFHSDPSSLRNSPERFSSPSMTKKLLSKFFNDSLEYDISSTPSTSTNGLPKDKITGIIS